MTTAETSLCQVLAECFAMVRVVSGTLSTVAAHITAMMGGMITTKYDLRDLIPADGKVP